jgi:hypothetical protein
MKMEMAFFIHSIIFDIIPSIRGGGIESAGMRCIVIYESINGDWVASVFLQYIHVLVVP